MRIDVGLNVGRYPDSIIAGRSVNGETRRGAAEIGNPDSSLAGQSRREARDGERSEMTSKMVALHCPSRIFEGEERLEH